MLELDPMSSHVREVFFGFLGSGSSQTFVVFDAPGMPILSRKFPFRKLGQWKKRLHLKSQEYTLSNIKNLLKLKMAPHVISFGSLDDWSDEFLEKGQP